MESGKQLDQINVDRTPIIIEIRNPNPSFTYKDYGIKYLESGIHGVKFSS